jgi:hypothetical protein
MALRALPIVARAASAWATMASSRDVGAGSAFVAVLMVIPDSPYAAAYGQQLQRRHPPHALARKECAVIAGRPARVLRTQSRDFHRFEKNMPLCGSHGAH